MLSPPLPRYCVAVALGDERFACLVGADFLALTHARLVTTGHLLQRGDWEGVLAIIRVADGAVVEQRVVGTRPEVA